VTRVLVLFGAVLAALLVSRWALARYRLSLAKHRSLGGHARWSQRLARLVPFYEFGEEEFFDADEAPMEVEGLRRRGF
jgi:glutamate-1-semialdehyde 2,1-aminomutase